VAERRPLPLPWSARPPWPCARLCAPTLTGACCAPPSFSLPSSLLYLPFPSPPAALGRLCFCLCVFVLSLSLSRLSLVGGRALRAQFRNQYDNDITTWSPQGRLHQIEYAMEAVKQGSAVVGLKSDTHVVLLALKARVHTHSHTRTLTETDRHTWARTHTYARAGAGAHVTGGLQRTTSEMASYQPKVFKIDGHLGIGIAGLASDGRSLWYAAPCVHSVCVYVFLSALLILFSSLSLSLSLTVSLAPSVFAHTATICASSA
jgi:hypothetical protein